MAIIVSFYTFAKRDNSTKRPASTTAHTDYSCVMKEESGVMNPVLRVTTGGSCPASLNYAYIAEFGRYYFVDDWTATGSFWIASLKVDVLASWKTVIGAANKYVLRSASSHNLNVPDSTYPAIGNKHETITSATGPFSLTNVWYCVGIIGESETSAGSSAVQYYAMTSAQLATLSDELFGTSAWLDIDSEVLDDNLQKAIFNPIQYVASCMAIPGPLPVAQLMPVSGLKFGWWDFPDVDAYYFKNDPTSRNQIIAAPFATVSVPKHPQAATRGAWLNNQPFSNYRLLIEPFGTIVLDASLLANVSKIECGVQVDGRTGQAVLTLAGYSGSAESPQNLRNLGTFYAQVGAPVQLAQMSTNLQAASGAVSGYVGAAIAGFSGNLLGGVMSAGSAIASAISGVSGHLETKGADGTLVNFSNENVSLYFDYFDIADNANDEIGMPLCAYKTINTLSGYVQVLDGDLEVAATAQEVSSLKAYLEGGFFYE